MTDKEIRRLARERLAENTDIVIISIIYFFSIVIMLHMCEAFVSSVIKMFMDPDYSFFGSLFDGISFSDLLLLVIRMLMYYVLIAIIQNILLRYYINMNDGGESERFVSRHWSRMISPCLLGSMKMLFYKLLVTSPLFFGIYGIQHFRTKGISEQLTMIDLVCFMLCIGFSIVWAGELVHYFISLSLVKYIYAINPRANFFDACDLSVKLMDGKHMRVMSFWFGMLPYIFPAFFVYPLLLIYPFVTEAKLIFCHEIMGSYWQDKIPAMARRWDRQQKRLSRNRV